MRIFLSIFIFINCISLQAQQTNIQYINDDINRLIQVTYPSGAIIQYKYDKVGNRTEHKIIGTSTPADLTIVNLVANPISVGQGGTLSLSFLLQNAGQLAAGNSQTKIYLNTSNDLNGAILIDSINHNGVPSGGTNVNKNITIPPSTTLGSKYIILVADSKSQMTEGNENNNQSGIAIIVVVCNSITANISSVTNATCNLSNGAATVTAIGGTSYTYQWNTIPPYVTATASNISSGTYNVTVTAQNGCSATATTSITNNGVIPAANFLFTASSQYTIQFTNTSTNSPTSYAWNFGNGFTSTQASPSHTFQQPGTFNVCLTATNSCGSDTKCQNVVISNGCEYPINIQAGNIGKDTATISWSFTSSAISYNLRYKKTSDVNWINVNGINVLYKTLTGLIQNTAYVYQIQTVCGSASSSFSNNQYFVTQNQIQENTEYYGRKYISGNNMDRPWFRSHINQNGNITTAGIILGPGNYNTGFIAHYDTLSNFINGFIIDSCTTCNTRIWPSIPIGGNSTLCYADYGLSNGTNPQLLFKASQTGQIIVEKEIPSSEIAFETNFTKSGNNGAYLFGRTYGVQGSFNNCGMQITHPIILKIDSSLNTIQAKKFEILDGRDYFRYVQMTDDGNIIAINRRFNDCSTGYKSIITKINGNNLNIIWAKQITLPNNGFIHSGERFYEDNTGYYFSNHIKTSNGSSPDTTTICKIDKSNGNMIWIKKYWSNDGNKLFLEFSDKSLPILHAYSSGKKVVKIDPNGNIIYAKRLDFNTRDIIKIGSKILFTGTTLDTKNTAIIKSDEDFDSCYFSDVSIMSSSIINQVNYSNYFYGSVTDLSLTFNLSNYVYTQPILHSKKLLCLDECNLIADFTMIPDTICPNIDLSISQLCTGNPTSFTWLKNNTFVSNSPEIEISFNQSGLNKITLICESNDGCLDTLEKTIYVRMKPSINNIITQPTCQTSTNGAINLTLSEGTPPYTYLWSNTSISSNISSLGVGSYSVTVTDIKGCANTGSYLLVQTTNLPIANLIIPSVHPLFNGNPNPYCNLSNNCFLSIELSHQNATTCQYSYSLNTNSNPTYSNIPCTSNLNQPTLPGNYILKFKATNVCGEDIKESLIEVTSCQRFVDADGDGYGNPNSMINDCFGVPTGYVNNNLDCDDGSNQIYPQASEVCDSIDNNCNNLIDEGCPYYFPPPSCVSCINPSPNETNVVSNLTMRWTKGENAIKYKLYLGTTSLSPTDIHNGIEILDTFYSLPAGLPFSTTLYAKIVPFSTGGNPLNCSIISFTTQSGVLPNPVFVSHDTNSVSIKYGVYLKESAINNLKVFGSQTGLKSGVYSMINDTLTFTSAKRFRPGEQLTIVSKKEVKTVANQDSKAFSFERMALTPTQGVVNFDSIGTGIILPNISSFAFGGSRMVDLNNDGMIDFVHLSTVENKLYIYFRNLNGTFQAPIVWGINVTGSIKAIADFNNDEKLDILFSTVPSGNWDFHILFNSPNGLFSNQPIEVNVNYHANFLNISDFNNDGLIDIVAPWNANAYSNCSNCHFRIHINNGNNNFNGSSFYYTNPGHITSILTKDLDIDGDEDILLTTGGNSLRIWENNGLGVYSQSTNISSNGKILSEIDRFNGDNNQDLITISSNTEIFLSNSGINYNLNNPTQVSISSLSVFRGDLDGDGDLDIMNGVTNWYSNNGNGQFTSTPIPGTRTEMRSFELFDYDNDGDLDQVFLNPATKEVKILRNLSDRKIPIVEMVDNNKVTIKYQKNVLTSTISSNNIKVQGDETGSRSGNFAVSGDLVTFTSTVPFRAGEKVHITSRSAVQYQGGGNAPSASFIEHANVTNLTTATFDTIGTGVFIPLEDVSNFIGATMADVNSDSKLDMLYKNVIYGNGGTDLRIFRRNANGTFASPIEYYDDHNGIYIVGTPDLNGDGKVEFILGYFAIGKLQIRLGNTNGTYSSSTDLIIPDLMRGGEICDVDNDGDLDLIIFCSSNSSTYGYDQSFTVIKNNGLGTMSIYNTTQIDIFGNSMKLGDADKDGDIDIYLTSINTNGSQKRFRIYKNDGNGNFALWIDEDNSLTKTIARVEDFNSDENLDIISNSPRVELYYGENQNSQKLANPIDTFINSSAIIHTGDIDGDGDLDLFIPNTSIANSSLIKAMNNGDNTFSIVQQTGTKLSSINPLDMMDYDNDGDLDYLFINPATGEIKVAINNCNYVTTLTLDNSPLTGVYQANQEIILQGNLNILSNTNVIFKTPEVISKGQLTAGNLSNIIIDPNGCN